MEYGLSCDFHTTNKLWGNLQIDCHLFVLDSFYHHHFDREAYEATVLKECSLLSWHVNNEIKNEINIIINTMKKLEDNKNIIDSNNNNNNNNDKDSGTSSGDDSSKSTNNSYNQSGNYSSSSSKSLYPFSHFGLDKNYTTITPSLSEWVLGAYTAMLGMLSAATTIPFETIQIPSSTTLSDSESECNHSSYTTANLCNNSSNIERSASRKHIIDCHRAFSALLLLNSGLHKKISVKYLPTEYSFTNDIDNNSNNNNTSKRFDLVETDIGVSRHMVVKEQKASSNNKKTVLTLQRVRYEREEYKCTECSYACTIEKAFQRHLRAHEKGNGKVPPETILSCAVCGADRSSEVDLSRHMRKHRDDRYFCCDICVFRTVQLKKLIQHRRMHTGEKPHLCPHCTYRSARRDNLRSHVRRVHKEENLYCDTFSPQGTMLIVPSLSHTAASSSNNAHV